MISVDVHVVSHYERYRSEVMRPAVNKILEAIGQEMVETLQENLGVDGPPGSAPGEYPHRFTGRLQQGAYYRVHSGQMQLEVGDTAPYARSVERRRPYLSRILEEMGPRISRIVKDS